MGLVLEARCGDCDFAQGDLKLGGTHEQIAAHDVSHYQVFPAGCCRRLQSVLLLLGQPLPEVDCDACSDRLALVKHYRVSTLKGEQWSGHTCPACAAESLTFERVDTFL